MKAAVLKDYGQQVTVEDLELQGPKKGEVLVKMKAAGICHSDLHVVTADLPLPVPMVLGHEGAGIVEEVGAGVTRVKKGDHVVLNWVPECGTCYYCHIGRKDMCDTAQTTAATGTLPDGTTRFHKGGEEIYQFSMTGTFSEFTVVPENGVIPINKDIPFSQASLVGCGILTGFGAVVNTAKVVPGSSVVVIGAGGVGLNVIQSARLAGAERIIAVDITANKFETARLFGATHTVNAKETDVIDQVLQLTNGRGADYAFKVIGSPGTIAQSYNCLGKGGTAVVVGIAPPHVDISINAFSLPAQSRTITGSWYGQSNPIVDIPKVLDLYMAKKIKLDELISKRYTSLEGINEAFDDLKEGRVARSVVEF
ncbi:Zn-dependent alcohol dehydrogenase [Bacillus sp. CECT 9360]|uniref:Zn-dependent alcohol dehydrogenase n=1 Tax=Bacillus sp. CECT 9360 TaxID=2845821 RepID=UPI001E4A7F80|nr:Zn-dependent alcohol dehydrogenase [Bacillus sp. CECT 9360]CAH0347396.1 NDMA-dependent alcohol dehydrogenase [Bacillus sp. CECT 9360]